MNLHLPDTNVPDDLVVVGQIGQPYGVKGWLHIHPFSAQADALLGSEHWWLTVDEAHWRSTEIDDIKPHGAGVVVKLAEVETREQAQALRNTKIGVARTDFPDAGKDEYYWVDLIGLTVENTQGVRLGTVVGLLDNAAHSILQVERPLIETPAAAVVDKKAKPVKPQQELIPFVARHVLDVNLAAKKIVVDWEL